MTNWHQLTPVETLVQLNSSPSGLTPAAAALRLAEHGPNTLTETAGRSPWRLFFAQFADFMILVLLAAAVVAALAGDVADALPIVAIVLINAVIGFVQEYRAEAAMAALRKMAGSRATLLRNGRHLGLDAGEIVPGDVVLLEAGNVVPADLRLLEAMQLRTVEATLTGESLPAEKTTGALADAELALGDRCNMAFKGTIVAGGRGVGIAVATGMTTELGRIAAMLQGAPEAATPLQRRLAAFGRRLALAILLLCAGIFVLGLLRGEAPLLMFLTAISLAVAAIPEALPAVVTISLALGARKMVRQHALIRRLPAVETLGSIGYICSDKTGTLTLNRMAVEEFWTDGQCWRPEAAPVANAPRRLLLSALALCNDARRDASGALRGDPTETALLAAAAAAGFEREAMEAQSPRLAELPFDSERKCMTTLHRTPEGLVGFSKGAVEEILARATTALGAAGEVPLDRAAVIQATEVMAARGLRVLAVALRRWKALPQPLESATVEKGLVLLGLAGMLDPPRPEAAEAVALCKSAGITPVMITGDHPLTATIIARRLAILEDGDAAVVTGRELAELTLEEFETRVERIRVYARVAPEQKLKIVQALQERGHFVAMTGDGVNDAPALKRADIGIAMGITGSDVAKESSAMVLLDDNFATIVNAVREGRRVYANILRFVTYSITCNTGTLVAITLAPFCGLPLPLLPIQILWLNLLCDGLPGLALAGEQAERDVMRRPPIDPQAGIFSGGRGWQIAGYGLLIGAAALALQAVALRLGLPWQSMVFTFLVFNRMAVALAVRSERQSLLTIGPWSNRPLVVAIVVTCLLQLAVIYLSPLRLFFHTESLPGGALAATAIFAGVMIAVTEIEKYWRRKLFRRSA